MMRTLARAPLRPALLAAGLCCAADAAQAKKDADAAPRPEQQVTFLDHDAPRPF